MALLSPQVEHLLSSSHGNLPLFQSAMRPDVEACAAIRSQGPALLFPDARDRQAALAGLLLRVGCWADSHQVSQDIHSAEGSYWHGIAHRIEPDLSNAAYWFRQVGNHPIFSELHAAAANTLNDKGPKHWRLKSAWDPFLFIRWCEEAVQAGGQAEAAAEQVQMAEWRLLFGWCARGSK